MGQTSKKPNIKSQKLYKKLKTERDELKLKTHLMKAELADKWDVAEEKWSRFKMKFSVIKKGTSEAASDLASGFSVLGREIKEAYQDIKTSIQSSKLTK